VAGAFAMSFPENLLLQHPKKWARYLEKPDLIRNLKEVPIFPQVSHYVNFLSFSLKIAIIIRF
jgi:hypothetical protein